MTGWDGGFFGLPFTCECRIYGETENRKNCSYFEKKITKSYLLDKIKELEKENEQLRNELQFYDKIINFFASNPMTKYSSKADLIEEMTLLEKMGLL